MAREIALRYAPAATTWNLVGYNGAAYLTVAALNAALDTPFPNSRDLGANPNVAWDVGGGAMLTMKSEASGGGDGSDFYYIRVDNVAGLVTPPSGAGGTLVRGTNQGYTIRMDGASGIWIRLTAASDIINMDCLIN